MENKGLVIVYNSESHNWKSCEELEESLYRSYKNLCPKNTKFLDLAKDLVNIETPKVTIVIITHKVTSNFWAALEKNNLTQIIWHVFGNFANLFTSNTNLSSILEQFHITLVAASSAQANRINYYLQKDNYKSIKVLSFSADSNSFRQRSQIENEKTRKKYSLKSEDYLICYAGRLSFQKNITLLLKQFSEFAAQDSKANLLLCGNFDDLGFTEIGLKISTNAYQAQIMRYLDSLPLSIKSRIKFLGNLDKESLAEILSTSDLFISLSTYILEDFGLAPVQALLSGTPVAISNWGGYRDTKIKLEKDVDLIDIRLDDDLLINTEDIMRVLSKYSKKKLTHLEKTELAKKTKSIYSSENLKERLRVLLRENSHEKFPGFNQKVMLDFTPEEEEILLTALSKLNKHLKEIYLGSEKI
ncbi:MAG: glycosyltransferase family 4 protein [Bdellovibrionales bacterium]|nr:glycosyltransferase family 4 protein [Bdellovibrionales bacterium]